MRKSVLTIWPDAWLIATLGLFSLAAVGADAPAINPPVPSPPGANSVTQPPAAAKCQEALVNPVSGFAECVKPRGAPVAPPPKRPDAEPDAGRTGADKAR
jgi:hypothetical protein